MKFFLTQEACEKELTPLTSPRSGDAGYDLRSLDEIELRQGEQAIVRTGLHISLPVGWVGLLRDRSSMAQKRIYVHSGVIDASYRGEVKVIIENGGSESFRINVNDKIVQMVIVPHYFETPQKVGSLEELGETDRGQKGFGSTGLS
jgi:dUTP pyrophosphatase